jgi:glycosyltransferase involved in cell wall biosynthesis
LRALFINSFYAPDIKGGAEITLQTLVHGMASRGHNVSVLTLNPTGARASEIVDGIEVTRMPTPNLYEPYPTKPTTKFARFAWKIIDSYNPKAQRQVSAELSRRRPDIVFTHNLAGISVAAWQACRRLGIPVVHVLHDYYLVCPNISMMKGTAACGRICAKCKSLRVPHAYLSSRVHAVVGVSRSILKGHEDAGLFRNVDAKHVIYNARDIKASARRQAPGANLVFGFIGGLTPVKGVDQLVRAFQKVARASPNTRLLIAGKGDHPDYVEGLHESARSLPVEFLGYVPSQDFYPRIDVLVVPSLCPEALASVVFEAMAYSVPVIGSNRGGIPEMITHSVNGLLYDPSDDANLVEAMRRVLRDRELLDTLRSQAAQSASHFTSTARMVAEYETLASLILDKSAQHSPQVPPC